MFKKEAPVYSAALIIYLAVITLLSWPLQWPMALFWLGGFLGLLLYNLDHLVYLLWQSPDEPTALEFKQLLKSRRFKGAANLLVRTCQERKRLVGHSVIFQAVLVALTFFTLSSTASYLGKGLVMGLFFYALINQGRHLARGGDLSSWFWQVNIKPTRKGEAIYFLALLFILAYFSWMLI